MIVTQDYVTHYPHQLLLTNKMFKIEQSLQSLFLDLLLAEITG